jgi:integrase/recombinase XerD
MTSDEIQSYLDHLALERRLSPRTVDAYGRDLKQFVSWVGGAPKAQRAAGSSLSQVDYATLARYMQALDRAGLKATSMARHQSSLRGFFGYLVSRGQLERSPAVELGRPRVRRGLPKGLAIADVERLLATPDPHTLLGQRDLALLEVLYATGMRVSEVTGLVPGRLHLDQGYLVCWGKGGKERAVPLGVPARAALGRYLASGRGELLKRRRGPAGRGEAPVFLNFRGGPLTRAGVFEILNRHARAAGLLAAGKTIGPHTLRHAFATHLLSGGADLRVVQELLGHASITTTQIYTRVEPQTLREIHARFHPRG